MTARDLSAGHLAIVAAFRREVSELLRRQPQVSRLGNHCFRFELKGVPVVLAIAGAGRENAYRAACDLNREFLVTGLVSIGFAGGLRESVRAGELVLAEEVIEGATGERYPCHAGLLPIDSAVQGSLLSAATVVISPDEKRALERRWGAIAVDMESGGVARASKELGVPFAALKSITDVSDQSIAIDFQRCRSDDEGLSSWKIVREGMANPRGLRDLWRLAGSSRRAAGKLALALCSV